MQRKETKIEYNDVNEFLKETKEMIPYFSSNTKEFISLYFKEFFENIFVCYFLYDCIIKGIKAHLNSIESRMIEISKKISQKESEIYKDFRKLMNNTELIIILAYKFFINYLYNSFKIVYFQNLSYLKTIEKIEYRGHEVIEKIINNGDSLRFIIRDLINLKIFGTKEEGNLRTNPSFWIKLFEETGMKLDPKSKSFWEALHERRNAASYIDAKGRWEELKNTINEEFIDVRIWLYGLLLLAYKIDKEFCLRLEIDKSEMYMNFKREPIYEMEEFV